jgi:hypothetical protein
MKSDMAEQIKKTAIGLRVMGVLVVIALLGMMTAFAQSVRNVYNFDVHGLQLNMDLDEVIKTYEIHNIKTSKDPLGIINGYEIKKQIDEKKIVLILNFTGEKRLYRIQYSSLLEDYRYRTRAVYRMLVAKYGPPSMDNLKDEEVGSDTIHACWGTTCNTYPQSTPTLTADIFPDTGILRLRLFDNRIFNKDWQQYRTKQDEHLAEKEKERSRKKPPNF